MSNRGSNIYPKIIMHLWLHCKWILKFVYNSAFINATVYNYIIHALSIEKGNLMSMNSFLPEVRVKKHRTGWTTKSLVLRRMAWPWHGMGSNENMKTVLALGYPNLQADSAVFSRQCERSRVPYMRENSAPDNNWLNKIWFFLLLQ